MPRLNVYSAEKSAKDAWLNRSASGPGRTGPVMSINYDINIYESSLLVDTPDMTQMATIQYTAFDHAANRISPFIAANNMCSQEKVYAENSSGGGGPTLTN